MPLIDEACAPCRDGSGLLEATQATALLAELNGWAIENDTLVKHWTFKNFKAALTFVNEIGAIAEAQKHHPDISFGWGFVDVMLTTHSAEGLTRNDFIVAAKIDAVALIA